MVGVVFIMGNNKFIQEDVFNYGLMRADVAQFCKETGISERKFSTEYLLHSESYIRSIFDRRRLTPQIAIAICKTIGREMKRYKVEKQKPVDTSPAVTTKTATGWDCKVSVNEEFGIVSLVIIHDGEVFTKGHARIDGYADKDIAKSISYAAHICYKAIEQQDFVNRINQDDSGSSCSLNPFMTSAPFKEYIVKFTSEKTERGELARYVSANYAKFPSWGEKKIRSFLVCERASKQVVDAFDACFSEYINLANRG